jgi:hypothetical protein
MKPVFQTKYGPIEGNCFNACVASILECNLDDLPDLNNIEASGKNWLVGLNEQLRPMGYGITSSPATEEQPATFYLPIGCHFIVSGLGPRGVRHSVVARKDGEESPNGGGDIINFVHDPIGKLYLGIKTVESFQMVVKL